jgi:hypothetical protein
MESKKYSRFPDDFKLMVLENFVNGIIGQVAFPGSGEAAIKGNPEPGGVLVFAQKARGCFCRAHGMAAGRPMANPVYFTYLFHLQISIFQSLSRKI